MDAFSSLFPINQIGSDGFAWWIGQVESSTYRSDGGKDPKRSGRYKVRIVGHHPKTCTAVPTEDLPWAITMMPVTDPYAAGATRSKTPRLESGDWVVGFFLDREQQQPVIMGSIGQVANAGPEPVEDPNPGDGCKSFTTFKDPEVRQVDAPADDGDFNPSNAGHPLVGGNSEDVEEGPKPSLITNLSAAKRADASDTNRAGINFSVAVATNCGEESDLNSTFTRLLSEMLRDVQQSNGKVGTYLVGQWTGQIYDTVDIGRKYVNKAIRIMETFVAKVKGYIIDKIKAGIDDLIKMILRPDENGNALTPLTKYLNELLANLGCSIQDLGLRLQSFLEDLLFGYLFSIYKAAACQVDKLVAGILNKIQSLMEELLSKILGPIQEILGAVASALNIIGDAINYVLNLLGIQCDGPSKGCKKTTVVTTKCKTDKKEDFLDKLLKDLDEPWDGTGADWSTYTCEEAFEGTKLENTEVVIIGGTQKPPKKRNLIEYDITETEVTEGEIAKITVYRFGLTSIASSVSFFTVNGTADQDDYQSTSGVLGFSPGETQKEIEIQTFVGPDSDLGREDFFVRLRRETPGPEISFTQFRSSYGRIIINPLRRTTGGAGNPPSNSGATNIDRDFTFAFPDDVVEDIVTNNSDTEEVVEVGEEKPTYSVRADRATVKENEFVTYTITTTNVESGTELEYRLFGTNITGSDIIGGNLQGSFVIESNSAKVVIGIEEDGQFEDDEVLIFGIQGTGASASVIILGDIADLSPEDLQDRVLDDTTPDDTEDGETFTEPRPPTTKPPITDDNGGIIDIPIDDPGDPYIEPPTVIIPGAGSGATAIALLDADDRVSEIRVTTAGSGYKLNLPADNDVRCIIDSYTMLSPGVNYTSAPDVYVDGEKGKAEAVIDDQGFVVSIRVLDRETTYERYPDVRILGGGGFGARYIPSITCLDTEALVKVGSAKIGTGRYIDCP